MEITRKEFCAAVGSGTVLLFLQACGGGGGSYSAAPAPSPAPASACGAEAISGNHGHALTIPLADLDSMVDKTYSIRGTADHDHTVTLTAAQLQSLKTAGSSVTVTSSIGTAPGLGDHQHSVTSGCS